MNSKLLSTRQAEQLLIAFFQRNGCIRLASEKHRKEMGQKYKKGYEVRLTANSTEELETMRQLLQRFGFKPGNPYKKVHQIVQPIYGKAAVEWFTRRAGQTDRSLKKRSFEISSRQKRPRMKNE